MESEVKTQRVGVPTGFGSWAFLPDRLLGGENCVVCRSGGMTHCGDLDRALGPSLPLSARS